MKQLWEVMAILAVPVLAGAAQFSAEMTAGRTDVAGRVNVWNDTANVYVQIAPAAAWAVDGAQWHMARTAAAIPQKNGNPTPGKFAAKMGAAPWQTALPLGGLRRGDTVCIAVHAQMRTSGGGEVTWAYQDGVLTNVLLIAGGYAPAAFVSYAIEDGQMAVTISALWGWLIGAAHVYTGLEPPFEPTPGDFPYVYTAGETDETSSHTFTIPLPAPQAAETTLCVATHATMLYLYGYDISGNLIVGEEEGWAGAPPYTSGPAFFCLDAPALSSGDGGGGTPREEGAWAAGLPFPGKNWATYFLYTIE